ncbi:hypothetical protein [Pseudomonas jilinensis]|uniref:Uncharacterized protein n=1 Tax=Pseudomonas jilinensis TaxID=2078689 RepID=A0A396S6Z6_9PSED|nr:hypothetical protein [Pseudomonas jilinensis]RHW21911.1 hypothetical protein C2846_05470 [Pseudomonas jilinensis]
MSDQTMPQDAAIRIQLLRAELGSRFARLRSAFLTLESGDDLAEVRFDLALADVLALIDLVRRDKQLHEDARRYRYLRGNGEEIHAVTALDYVPIFGAELDEAIDDALSQFEGDRDA